uniref:Mitochondrial-processing peptidase subunit alpha n=1 Tax=Caenorhabditis tropicalis TaxID=1561998 RepID=A0A1I7T0T7_9PELO
METGKVSSVNGAPVIGRNSRVTQLPNGLKVCTENTYGDFVTIGVAVESGCRFENGFPFGVSRVVEKLAFSSSENFMNRDDVYAQLEESSGIVDCQSTRDTMMYAASCHRSGVDSVTKVLSDTIWRPVIDDESLDQAKMIVRYESEDLPQRIEAIEILLTDYIHQAAFQNNTIGYPKFGLDSLDKIRVSDVYGFLSRVHTPERMVVGGVGVDHDEFVSIISRYFDTKHTIWNTNPSVLPSKIPEIDKSRSQYTGGELRLKSDLTPLTIGKPYPLLAHVVLGLEGCSYKDDDFVAFCVLQSLLGGGGAFSAGGPGKGMYARFYTELMNQHHWIYSAIAHNHSYSDSGVFTMTASTYPENINDALICLVQQVLQLKKGVSSEELARARTQLRSHLMMNLEVRPVLFEDMVRQVLGHGERKQPEEYAAKIEKVSNSDIERVVDRLLSSKPSLVGYGEIDKLGDLRSLDQALAKRDLRYLFK